MYNLNAVGKHFLGETKVDLKAHEMFEIHQETMRMMQMMERETGQEDEDLMLDQYFKSIQGHEREEKTLYENLFF